MSVLLLVNVAILLFTNEAISKCPPDSGKPTLNSVSCVICWLLLVGIYLMYNGDCYPNGSYFENTAITAIIFRRIFDWHMHLQCVLPNSTLSGGEWSRSNGGPVDCTSNTNSDPLRCITTNTPATLSLYKPYGQEFLSSEDQLYKCCLPTNCSNPTYIITAYIFSKLSHCTSTYCHLL